MLLFFAEAAPVLVTPVRGRIRPGGRWDRSTSPVLVTQVFRESSLLEAFVPQAAVKAPWGGKVPREARHPAH